MPVTKIYSKWEAGDLVFYNSAGTELLRFDESAGQIQINGVAIDVTTLDELAAIGGLTATVTELNQIHSQGAVAADYAKLHAITAAAAAINAVVAGVAGGYKLARGVAAVTGTATVATGLTTVVAVIATASSDPDGTALAEVSATIGDQAGAPAAGSVILKCWKITAADNGALIAATAAKNVNWVAIGV